MEAKMAEAYWNAFRDGYIAVGGNPQAYPRWDQSRDPQKNETIRCMRHAVEVLRLTKREREPGEGGVVHDPFADLWNEALDRMFPEPPKRRKLKETVTDRAFLVQTAMGELEG